ncbi:HNH endonuclease [Aeromonas veronii]|uniref:HNH endonuclease n=1 Tax=Aeromonas veronii TaxID=654 RepID=UPI003D2247E1
MKMKLDFCCACGSTENLHQHHLMPRSLGGTDDEENLITLCGECHGVIHGLGKEHFANSRELQRAGYERAKAEGRIGTRGHGKRIDRDAIRKALENGMSIRKIADELGVSTFTVQQIKKGA